MKDHVHDEKTVKEHFPAASNKAVSPSLASGGAGLPATSNPTSPPHARFKAQSNKEGLSSTKNYAAAHAGPAPTALLNSSRRTNSYLVSASSAIYHEFMFKLNTTLYLYRTDFRPALVFASGFIYFDFHYYYLLLFSS